MKQFATTAVCITMIVAAASNAQAGFIGQTFGLNTVSGNAINSFQGPATAGPNIEFLNVDSGLYTVDISDTNIRINFLQNYTFESTINPNFNGFQLFGLTPNVDFVPFDPYPISQSVGAGNNLSGYTVSLPGIDVIRFNFVDGGALTVTPQSVISVDFQFPQTTAVPEPSTLAIFGIGALGLVLGRRRLANGRRSRQQ